MSAHISAQVHDVLTATGWDHTNQGTYENKVHTGGEFGKSIVILDLDDSGRWLERIDGWGKVEREVDLREFADDPAGAIAAALA